MICKVVFDVPLDRSFDYAIPPELESRVQVGVRITAPFGHVLTCGLVTEVNTYADIPPHVKLKFIASVVDTVQLFGSDLFPLAQFIKENWGGAIGQILFALVPSQPYYKTEKLTGRITVTLPSEKKKWTSCQQKAWDTLHQFNPYTFHPVLLSGPSNTGKTETVLRAAGEALSAYGQVLLTVPDIVAARQFIREAEQRFGAANVFSWHSRMLLSRKKKCFSAVCNGAPCIVIGTRSAVLLPFKNLRFAAMLGEGDENYKQEENKPYYHAREVLLFRAQLHGTPVAFVSNAPSMEMMYYVGRKHITHIAFNTPVTKKNPSVPVKITAKKGEKSRLFSDELLAELSSNLSKKQPSLLVLNRRGYAHAYYCLNCGAYAVCKKCGTILTLEKADEHTKILVCKKCGHKESTEQECAKCHNVIFKSRGGGTQKVVTELAKLFPQANILRLDSDSLQRKQGEGYRALEALTTGNADIIVGTRIVSGALRGAKVTLAAILDAELELDGPDFRAGEKYTQLLFNLRGYLASVSGGRLLIQTSKAEKYNYQPVIDGNFEASAQEEMSVRESFSYPPFACLVRVTVKAKEADVLREETARLQRTLKPFTMEILGPVWCAKKTDVLQKQYLLFKTKDAQFLLLLSTLDHFEVSKKATLQILADPYNFY